MVERTGVVAFDIDGTLTDDNARDVYERLSRRNDLTVGIVTANPPFLAERFVEESGLEADFVQSAFFKSTVLAPQELNGGDSKNIYVGNSRRDRLAASVSGWEYFHVSEAEEVLDVI